VEALRSYGYELHSPEGTFYLLPTSPDPEADQGAHEFAYALLAIEYALFTFAIITGAIWAKASPTPPAPTKRIRMHRI
jgi:hypothetical protein